ncbi:unnamed protein product [Lactuca saligna]|uniref:Uncharacterized protein n=1 Tax=Lactuca saligna TaxID=75948 RepID=A0AA35ZYG5_LACSI|nr:unnamed protein product [Lactuca saligna]
MAQIVVPLNVVYPDTYFEGEIPQGTNGYIESDDEQVNPRKKKASFSGGANDAEAGSSSAVGGSSAFLPKKGKLTVDSEDLAKDWKIKVEEEPEQGIFYVDNQNQMCFQRTEDLPNAPTEHLFNLLLKVIRYKELEKGYHVLISFEHSKHLVDLHLDDFNWLKPEILTEAETFSNDDLDDSIKD